MGFEYFYGDEAEQFSFYRIPKLLMTLPRFKRLSDSAKLLYGLMLDRMGLSVRNGWFDDIRTAKRDGRRRRLFAHRKVLRGQRIPGGMNTQSC